MWAAASMWKFETDIWYYHPWQPYGGQNHRNSSLELEYLSRTDNSELFHRRFVYI